MQLLFEAKGTILKVISAFLIVLYIAVTGIDMSNELPIHRAL